jgi:hypothetical protein
MGNAYSSTAIKNSNIQRQRLDAQCIQSYPLRLHRDGAKRSLKEFLHKFGALNWIHWNADVASLLRKGVRSWGT